MWLARLPRSWGDIVKNHVTDRAAFLGGHAALLSVGASHDVLGFDNAGASGPSPDSTSGDVLTQGVLTTVARGFDANRHLGAIGGCPPGLTSAGSANEAVRYRASTLSDTELGHLRED